MRRLGADLEEKQEPRGALAAECNIVTHEMIRTSLTLAAIEKRSFLPIATEPPIRPAEYRPSFLVRVHRLCVKAGHRDLMTVAAQFDDPTVIDPCQRVPQRFL